MFKKSNLIGNFLLFLTMTAHAGPSNWNFDLMGDFKKAIRCWAQGRHSNCDSNVAPLVDPATMPASQANTPLNQPCQVNCKDQLKRKEPQNFFENDDFSVGEKNLCRSTPCIDKH